jgi:hypothetical protein
MLAGEAMIALAKLRDLAFRQQIEQIILDTQNPRVKIMGAEALGIYAIPDSLYTLISILNRADPPPYLSNEVVLAMSAIIGTQQQFSNILVRFAAEPSLAQALAIDEAEAAAEFYKSNIGWRRSGGRDAFRKKNELPFLAKQAGSIQAAVYSLEHNKDSAALAQWILDLPDDVFTDDPAFGTAQVIFPEILMDKEMNCQKCLHLLIIHWAAYKLRAWVKRLK